jgi:transglutaminase-like putative cysteine protease
MLRPLNTRQQRLKHNDYGIHPPLEIDESTDLYGNAQQRLLAPVGELTLHSTASVNTASQLATAPRADFVEIQFLPTEVLPYLLPSRYCESDRFGDMTREIVAADAPGYDQVQRISAWVQDNVRYIPGSSELPLSAIEVHQRGYGVCRDLAQLAIALCRSISIPARLVVGYLHQLEPMDMHAWFEAYVGNHWYTFDPSQITLKGGRVVIAFGRDAADVAIFHQFGSGAILTAMQVDVSLVETTLDFCLTSA